MQEILLKPVAFVENSRTEIQDDNWAEVESIIRLENSYPSECLDGIETFSHLHVLFYMDKVEKTHTGSARPRGNPDWPEMGIFAQRKKSRPNHLGLTMVSLIRREDRGIVVRYLDAINGTPVLDIKPVMKEFLHQGELKQPDWTSELMKEYW